MEKNNNKNFYIKNLISALVFLYIVLNIFASYKIFPVSGYYLITDLVYLCFGYLLCKKSKDDYNFGIKKFFYQTKDYILLYFLCLLIILMPTFYGHSHQFLTHFAKAEIFSLFFFSNAFFWFHGINFHDHIISVNGTYDGLFTFIFSSYFISQLLQLFILSILLNYFFNTFLKKFKLIFFFIFFLGSYYLTFYISNKLESFYFYSPFFYIIPFLMGFFLKLIKENDSLIKKIDNVYISKFIFFFSILVLIYYLFFLNFTDFYLSLNRKIFFYFCCSFIILSLIKSSWIKKEEVFNLNIKKIHKGIFFLFLIHFLLIFFLKYKFIPSHIFNIDQLLILSIVTILIFLTHYFLKNFKNTKTIVKILIPLIINLSLCLVILDKDGFKKKYPNILTNLSAKKTAYFELKQDGKICLNRKDNFCTYNKKKTKTIILVGASELAPLQTSLLKYSMENDYKFISMTIINCPLILNLFNINRKTRDKDTNQCDLDVQKNRMDIIKKHNDAIIIYSVRTDYFYNETFIKDIENDKPIFAKSRTYLDDQVKGVKSFEERQKDLILNIKKSVNEILKTNNKLILLYPIPEIGFSLKKKINSKIKKSFLSEEFRFDSEIISLPYSIYLERQKEFFAIFENMSNQNLIKIKTANVFCNNYIPNRCVTHDFKNIYYDDRDHLSIEGARLVTKEIINNYKLYINK